MQFNEHTAPSQAEDDGSQQPFAWILFTPTVTVPAALLFSLMARQSPADAHLPSREDGDCWLFCETYEYGDVIPTLLAFSVPGLLNLLPLVWALSAKGWQRSAYVIAGVLGLMRAGIPPIILMTLFDRLTNANGSTYFQFHTGSFGPPAPYGEVWLFGILAWLVSLLVWCAVPALTRLREDPPTRTAVPVAQEVIGAVEGRFPHAFLQLDFETPREEGEDAYLWVTPGTQNRKEINQLWAYVLQLVEEAAREQGVRFVPGLVGAKSVRARRR